MFYWFIREWKEQNDIGFVMVKYFLFVYDGEKVEYYLFCGFSIGKRGNIFGDTLWKKTDKTL